MYIYIFFPPTGPNPLMLLDFRLGYRNANDKADDWKLLAESVEDRKLECTKSNEVSLDLY